MLRKQPIKTEENPSLDQKLYAAIDLGSNSFHMIISRESHGQMQVIDKHKEMVRLRAGLDAEGNLTPKAFEGAIECLRRFGQLLKNIPYSQVRAVGTNTLRNAKNSVEFLRQAREALGHEIQIIAGQEEARLIYLGVCHGLANIEEQRLVMDIGGGSTEYIIGEGFQQKHLTSTEMGCVSITQKFFDADEITEKKMAKAINHCRLILRPHRVTLSNLGWQTAIGASGSIKSIGNILKENGWTHGEITLEGMKQLKKALSEAGSTSAAFENGIKGIKEERVPVLSGGLAILMATFEELQIEQMQVSPNALREGLIYDTLGRINEEDTREATVASMQNWLKVDVKQAQRVAETSNMLYRQAHNSWQLRDPDYSYPKLLKWGASLHEAGIVISYKRYRHHSAYIVENADMAGFTQQEKQMLGAMLLNHRGKFAPEVFNALNEPHTEKLMYLTVVLRLAVRIHRGREDEMPNITLMIEEQSNIHLEFEELWLKQHPLTKMDLEIEAGRLEQMGFKLTFE